MLRKNSLTWSQVRDCLLITYVIASNQTEKSPANAGITKGEIVADSKFTTDLLEDSIVVLKYALADIDGLLQEGFDSNIEECQMGGVRDTIREIKAVIARAEGSK